MQAKSRYGVDLDQYGGAHVVRVQVFSNVETRRRGVWRGEFGIDVPSPQSYIAPLILDRHSHTRVGYDVTLSYIEKMPLGTIGGSLPNDNWLGLKDNRPRVKHELGIRWDLSRVSTGLSLGDPYLVGSKYHSKYFSVDLLAAGRSSTSEEPAITQLQVRLSPTNLQSGQASVGVALGLDISYSPAPVVSAAYVITERVQMKFVDLMPWTPIQTVTLPADMLSLTVYFDIRENQKELGAKEYEKLRTWLMDLERRPDCRELWRALTESSEGMITVMGFASNTGTDRVNDTLSDARAKWVRNTLHARIGRDSVFKRVASYGSDRMVGGAATKAPPGPLSSERYVRIEISEADAKKAILGLR